MSGKRKIQVPEGMWAAFLSKETHDGWWDREVLRRMLESALRWLSGNPITPTDEQALELWDKAGSGAKNVSRDSAVEWQRRMFLVPEVPEELEDLLVDVSDASMGSESGRMDAIILNERVIEAFRRGQNSR